VAGAIPEAATDIQRLAGAFAVVAYAPSALGATVRPALLRRLVTHLLRRR
jgi:hypothetical protein